MCYNKYLQFSTCFITKTESVISLNFLQEQDQSGEANVDVLKGSNDQMQGLKKT